MIGLNFFKDRDNAEDLALLTNGTVIDPTAITRVVLIPSNGTAIDSDDSPEMFEWPVDVETGVFQGKKVIRLKLGSSELATGLSYCSLVTYDPTNPNGFVWGDLQITMN